jgi:hypothetical protein
MFDLQFRKTNQRDPEKQNIWTFRAAENMVDWCTC